MYSCSESRSQWSNNEAIILTWEHMQRAQEIAWTLTMAVLFISSVAVRKSKVGNLGSSTGNTQADTSYCWMKWVRRGLKEKTCSVFGRQNKPHGFSKLCICDTQDKSLKTSTIHSLLKNQRLLLSWSQLLHQNKKHSASWHERE